MNLKWLVSLRWHPNVPQEPTGVTLDKTTISLVVGGTETLTATVLPADADDKTVTFTSSDPTIATITPKQGSVVGKAAGTTTLLEQQLMG